METNPQPPKKEQESLPQATPNEPDPQDLIDLDRASWEGMVRREESDIQSNSKPSAPIFPDSTRL